MLKRDMKEKLITEAEDTSSVLEIDDLISMAPQYSEVASTCSELSCSALQERVDHIEDTLLKMQEQNQFVLEDLDKSIKRAEEVNGNMNKVLLELNRNKVGTDDFWEFKQCIKECMQMSADRLLELRGQLASKVDMENFAEDIGELTQKVNLQSKDIEQKLLEKIQTTVGKQTCSNAVGNVDGAMLKSDELERKLVAKMHGCFENLRKAMNILCESNFDDMQEVLLKRVDKYLQNKLRTDKGQG